MKLYLHKKILFLIFIEVAQFTSLFESFMDLFHLHLLLLSKFKLDFKYYLTYLTTF